MKNSKFHHIFSRYEKMQTNSIFVASTFVIHPQILIFSVFKISSLSSYWLQMIISFIDDDCRDGSCHTHSYQSSHHWDCRQRNVAIITPTVAPITTSGLKCDVISVKPEAPCQRHVTRPVSPFLCVCLRVFVWTVNNQWWCWESHITHCRKHCADHLVSWVHVKQKLFQNYLSVLFRV